MTISTIPVRNAEAMAHLQNAIAYLMLAGTSFYNKDQSEQAKAAEVLLDSACTLRRQITK